MPAVFLDRDGTINDDVGYVSTPLRVRVLPGVAEAIKRVNDAKIPVIVVTNQSGVGRGFFTEEHVREVNDAIGRILKEEGAHIDAWYYCPQWSDDVSRTCDCRKPQPGMLRQAAVDHGIDLAMSVMIGDKRSDMEVGEVVGAHTVLVLTGNGRETLEHWSSKTQPTYVANGLPEAIEWFLELKKRGSKA